MYTLPQEELPEEDIAYSNDPFFWFYEQGLNSTFDE